MHVSSMKMLVSPITAQPLRLVETSRDTEEVLEGALVCEKTGRSFPIRNGIPYFSPEAVDTNPTAQRFGYQWIQQAKGCFEKETIYGESATEELDFFLRAAQLTMDQLPGMRIADIGCGKGRLSRNLAEHGADVFAIDISNSVVVAHAQGLKISGLRIIQCDLHRLPFRNNFFDVVWADGVIHHTANPRAAFSALASKVAPGGKLCTYVYPQESSVYRRIRRWTPIPHRWPVSTLQTYCSIVAVPIWVARVAARKHQPYREVKFRLFDTLGCPYLWTHSVEEVKAWYRENQFHQVTIKNPAITALGVKKPGRKSSRF